ncbi:MAG: response regulator with CheY-like receiver domain and winged-helix DNA-binding [Gallionellaceae bacterium]|nr:MAG: response regulator with CheY-like receiver domain and winged-helix DNA-binding [Gallionellaceae bacterium]
MKAWWRNLSLHNKLQIPIQLLLLMALLLANVWVEGEFKKKLLEDAEQRAISSATQSFLGLNAMMLNGNISQPQARIIYFKKMAGQDDVNDFYLVRGKPVQDQFGIGLPEEQARDELDRNALISNTVQRQSITKGKPALRVVVPFAAQSDFHGTNCLQCHHVREGAVNGAVSLTISLAREYADLGKVRILLSSGQVLLQISLFFLIGFLIREAIASVVKLEKTMLSIKADGDLNKYAEVESGDEAGHIAQVFNDFLRYIAELKQQLADKVAVLEKYHDRTEEEQRVGSFIMGRMTKMPKQLEAHIQRHMRPVEHLNGDILIAAKSPGGEVHILLADAIGHGLTAAVNVLPLCQTFYDLTDKGFSIGQIATDLNAMVRHFMPTDRFVSAVLVSIHRTARVIEVWNGGIPALLLFNRTGQQLHRWSSANLPLGIVSGDHFSAKLEAFQYQEDCQLCLFSDGLLEASSPRGEIFGESRMLEILGKTEYEGRMQALIAGMEAHLEGLPAHDDISLALVDIGYEVEPISTSQINPAKTVQTNGDWHIAISLGAAELKYLDVVPLVTQIIAKINATREHHSALFMVLSELFNNALDHGVLQLNSALKLEQDGFDKFLELREERLWALQNGRIDIDIRPLEIDHKQAVQIRVADSGSGFDHVTRMSAPLDRPEDIPYGRGIALVKSVVYKLEYSGRGNEVTAIYICA